MNDEVLEHEGWLMKRGAGYQKGLNEISPGRSVRSASNQGSIQLMRNSSKVSISLAHTLSKTFKGRLEKRRYFKLLKVQKPPTGILVYYNKPTSSKEVGRIVFSHLDKVVLADENVVELSTLKRTFYLRPTGGTSDLDEEQSQLAAAQWVHAIQGVIEFMLDAKGISEIAPFPLLNQKSIHTQVSEIQEVLSGNYSMYSMGEYVDEDFVASKKLLKPGAKEARPKASYRDIWLKFGFEGYLKVLSQFGAVETDLTRLKTNILSKIDNLDQGIQHLEMFKNVATEPVIKHQKTTFAAFRSLYEQDKKVLQLYMTARDSLRKVLKKFDEERASLFDEITETKKRHQEVIDDLKKKKAAMGKARMKVKLNERMLANAREALTNEDVSGSVKVKSVFQKVRGRIIKAESSKESPLEQVESLELELQNCKSIEENLESVFRKTEETVSLRMIVVLEELQQTEENRIAFQKRIIQDISDTERGLLTGLIAQYEIKQNGNPSVLGAISEIVPEDDMKSTSKELAAVAKTARREYKMLQHKTAAGNSPY